MSGKQYLNGSDYLMLGFDHELRRHGFAGNSCQIVLELGGPIDPRSLQRRLDELSNRYPLLRARAGGIIRPQWKLPSASPTIKIRAHRDEPVLRQRLFNEPLATTRNELVRFDVIERDGGRTCVIFTWAHALMDAPGAEYFLAMVGNEQVPLPLPHIPAPRRTPQRLKERFKLAWKNLHQLDEFCRAAPRSPGVRHPNAPALMQYDIQKFSAAETERVRANAVRLCGPVGDAQYHAAVAVTALHNLHQELGCVSPSYVVPMPIGIRPKGAIEPLFSNQVAMLMLQFLPEHLDLLAHVVAELKRQTAQAFRANLLESGRVLTELFRFLPLPVFVAMMKKGLRGEICSLFYGDTAAVNSHLMSFLNTPVEDFAHIAAITPSPGIGAIFYYFRGELRVTVLHSAQVLNDDEASRFAVDLRSRLLNA